MNLLLKKSIYIYSLDISNSVSYKFLKSSIYLSSLQKKLTKIPNISDFIYSDKLGRRIYEATFSGCQLPLCSGCSLV